MGKSDCGKQCDKHCSVYKMHTYFQRLYRVSWGLTITEIVTFFLILLRVAILHGCFKLLESSPAAFRRTSCFNTSFMDTYGRYFFSFRQL